MVTKSVDNQEGNRRARRLPARSVSVQLDRAGMEAPHVDRRRQELDVDDEEGLLQLQVCLLDAMPRFASC
jgi:hypothetical protein